MAKVDCNSLGVAGELRVMSELLLRGYNPAKSYVEDGSDLILVDNGSKIEVKSAHSRAITFTRSKEQPYNLNRHGLHKGGDIRKTKQVVFSLKGGHRKDRQKLDGCDFLICWLIDHNDFYIIPSKEVKVTSVTFHPDSQSSKWVKYKNNWEVLNRR